jgi:hypothetical protein
MQVLPHEKSRRPAQRALKIETHGATNGNRRAAKKPKTPPKLRIEVDAELPLEKFHRLSERVPDFQKTWERRQRGSGRWTSDTYEAKLAHYAAQDDWSDQEITNLIIAFRRKHGARVELREEDYLSIIARTKLAERVTVSAATTAEALQIISIAVGVEISKMQRYLTEPPIYVLALGNGKVVQLGGVDNLWHQANFRKALIDYANRNMPVFKSAIWHDVVTRMLEAIEDVEAPFESTRLGAATNWLKSYVRDHVRPERVEEAQRQAVLDHKPGLIDGAVWFSMSGFTKFVKVEFAEHPQSADLTVWLKQIGCQYDPCKTIRIGENIRASRSLWMAPARFLRDGERPDYDNRDGERPDYDKQQQGVGLS